jgi:hypothetical protein
MGQMLSREDDDERQYDESQHAEDSAAEVKEKPKRRQQRNATAIRSRKPRTAIRTRRNRTTNPITFEVREH